MAMQVYSLSEMDERVLNSRGSSTAPVVFVGSGISLWGPTNLPTGNQFTKSVFSVLFQRGSHGLEGKNTEIVRKYFDRLPFEVINDRCPDPGGIERILLRLYDRYDPNPVHELLAALLSEGKIGSIVTPNYDCCLDTAIAGLGKASAGVTRQEIIRVVDSRDVPTEFEEREAVYFKIHGSTDDRSGRSLIFRLNQEGVLDPWKRRLFRRLIQDKVLLVIGYSGSDFDICPEIALAQPRKIIWNFLAWDEKNIPPNIRILSGKCDIDVVTGDMRDFLSRVFRPVTATFGRNDVDLESILNSTFDEDCKRLWRIRLYNSINFNKLTLHELRERSEHFSDPWTRIFLLSEYAAALASSGKYRDAAKLHDQTARIAEVELRDTQAFITQLLIACDTWRCYGSFLRSILRYRKAAELLSDMQDPPENLYADLDRNLILLIRHPYDLFQRTRMRRLEMKIQNIAGGAISRSVAHYRESGNWYGLQQLGLWEERFHLRMDHPALPQGYETPLSNEGYRQLNFPMGRMMAFRNSLRGLRRRLTKDETAELRGLIAEANELGILPEVWKLNLLVLLNAGKEERSFTDFLSFARAFAQCQYTLLFGIWRLLMRE